MADREGAEFFAIIPDGDGKSYRGRKQDALEQIANAIDKGNEPGEVRIER